MIERMKKITARFYANLNGTRPVREWLLGLTRDDRRMIGADIQRIEFGWPIGMPYSRPLGKGLREVRNDISGGRIAQVIFFIGNGEIVLLHGFVKKTQQTPQAEIDVALKRKQEVE